MQCKDVPTEDILEYLSERQGQWTSLWYGHFMQYENGASPNNPDDPVSDVYYAMPENTPHKLALAKMKNLHKRGLVGGCPCGCRGDFEITDKGLALINKERTKTYTGY